MLHKWMITVLAGASWLASWPVFALDLPESGSKNFSPAGDTPTYFTNESVPVSARTADTTANDWTVEEAAAPVPSVARPSVAGRRNSGRYSKYVAARRSGGHAASTSRASNHSTYMATPYTGKGQRVAPAASTAKTNTARHGKTAGRHAAAATS
jgi:hypothetical protein